MKKLAYRKLTDFAQHGKLLARVIRGAGGHLVTWGVIAGVLQSDQLREGTSKYKPRGTHSLGPLT